MGRVLVSGCLNPVWNLALEEWLIGRKEKILFLWQNEPSVIIGRNQDPFAECVPELLKKDGIHLVRRKSGGGAVYHDRGNLNITFLSPKYPMAAERNFEFLRRSLKHLGISAELSGRNDLEVQGRKISGSAFYETDEQFCHHCTMLVDTDLDAMTHYLTPPTKKLQSRGISSVRSRVANLNELAPGLTVRTLMDALISESGELPAEISRKTMGALPGLSCLAETYGSDIWTYGESPRANLMLEEKFSWGLIRAELQINSGRIESARITTDSLRTDGFTALARRLEGIPLHGQLLREQISAFPDAAVRKDLEKLFSL